mmetsp:Transcript_46680/g.111013  ORF Transcript_46680/g.111013 Transcript_46680/m.111013 type:complete len:313 (-) Transcript_46680:346-1284(-)
MYNRRPSAACAPGWSPTSEGSTRGSTSSTFPVLVAFWSERRCETSPHKLSSCIMSVATSGDSALRPTSLQRRCTSCAERCASPRSLASAAAFPSSSDMLPRPRNFVSSAWLSVSACWKSGGPSVFSSRGSESSVAFGDEASGLASFACSTWGPAPSSAAAVGGSLLRVEVVAAKSLPIEAALAALATAATAAAAASAPRTFLSCGGEAAFLFSTESCALKSWLRVAFMDELRCCPADESVEDIILVKLDLLEALLSRRIDLRSSISASASSCFANSKNIFGALAGTLPGGFHVGCADGLALDFLLMKDLSDS